MPELWTVNDRGYEFAILDDQGNEMATVPFDQSPIDQPLDSAEGRRATLLAATPNLLAALEAFVEDVRRAYIGEQEDEMLKHSALAHNWPDLCVTYRKAQKAIAAAKGAQ